MAGQKSCGGGMGTVLGRQKNDWLRLAVAATKTRRNPAGESAGSEAAPGHGLTDAQIDRLRLNPSRIEAGRKGMEEVVLLPDPVGQVIWSSVRPNGLHVQKVRCRWG